MTVQARVAAIELQELPQRHHFVGWLVVFRIYVALAIFQLYIVTWKQEITNFWNRSGETVNRTPDLFLRKPKS